MQVLPLTSTDLPHIKALQPPDWGDMTPHLQYYINSPYCSPIKVVIDGEIVGMGTSIKHTDTAWLAHIITHPNHRNKGIGYLVTKTLVERLQDFETVYLIATHMGEPVYKKLGFVTEMEYVWMKAEPQELEYDTTYIQPLAEEHKPTVLAFDQAVFGEDRITRLEQHWEKALVHMEGGVIEGYYFPTLGEGLIVADNPEVGLNFLKLRLKTWPITVIPITNTLVHDFLTGIGCVETIHVKRMRYGKDRAWQPEKIYSRVSGQIG